MLRLYGIDLPVHRGDLETIATPLDWLGVNYYSPSVIADDPADDLLHARETGAPGGAPRTMLDWEVRAEGLEQVLVRTASARTARCTTRNGHATSRSIWLPAAGRCALACRWQGTSPGRCSTTSNGREAGPLDRPCERRVCLARGSMEETLDREGSGAERRRLRAEAAELYRGRGERVP
jgi:hypothetical protein